MDLYAYLNNNCQKFNLSRTGSGNLVFTPLNGNRVVEVPNASTTDGVQLALFDYNGATCQQWTIGAP